MLMWLLSLTSRLPDGCGMIDLWRKELCELDGVTVPLKMVLLRESREFSGQKDSKVNWWNHQKSGSECSSWGLASSTTGSDGRMAWQRQGEWTAKPFKEAEAGGDEYFVYTETGAKIEVDVKAGNKVLKQYAQPLLNHNVMSTLFACTSVSYQLAFQKDLFYWCPKENIPISPGILWFEKQIVGRGTLGI